MTLFSKIVGLVLHIANAQKIFDRRFYELKSDLLNKYGKQQGEDIQYIEKECRTCDGTGIYKRTNTPCYNCYDGVYDKFTVTLARYKLGTFEFHKPIKRGGHRKKDANIIGYIRHKAYPFHIGYEAEFLLYLIFDREKFSKSFGKFSFPYFRNFKPQAVTPILLMSITYFKIKYDLPRRFGKLRKFIADLFNNSPVEIKIGEINDIPF